jgi:hypothetical protein
MHALLHDGWHSLTHLDGRMWSTLWVLLVKPGEVSRQFVLNRRARFLPPFRLYLVISLVFFGLIGATNHDSMLQFKLDPGENAESMCRDITTGQVWLSERLRATCQRAVADGGKSLSALFVASLPRAMFLFLPLIAAGQLLLYWRPRRLYVEHLVFFLHAHAAAFAMGALAMMFVLAAHLWTPLSGMVPWTITLLLAWLAIYLFLAMRRFYGQSRFLTFAKYLVLGGFYLFSLLLMAGLTLVFTALAA